MGLISAGVSGKLLHDLEHVILPCYLYMQSCGTVLIDCNMLRLSQMSISFYMMEIDMHFEVLQRLCNVLHRDGSNMSLGEQGRCWPCADVKHHLGKVGCVRQKNAQE